jgi:hypothetical protein
MTPGQLAVLVDADDLFVAKGDKVVAAIFGAQDAARIGPGGRYGVVAVVFLHFDRPGFVAGDFGVFAVFVDVEFPLVLAVCQR